MQAAIKAVEEDQTMSQAACDHGVLQTTLLDRVGGRVTHGTQRGPST